MRKILDNIGQLILLSGFILVVLPNGTNCPEMGLEYENMIFLVLTLLLVGRLDLAKTSSNSSFSNRQLKVLKPDRE